MRRLTTAVALLLMSTTTATVAYADNAKPAMVTSVTAVDLGALNAPIEKCIRDNASNVEAAIPSLDQAVDFLVGKVCAEPIAAVRSVRQRMLSERIATQWKKRCEEKAAVPKDQKSRTPDNEDTADMCSGPNSIATEFITEPYEESEFVYFNGASPPFAVALAARLLLDLRLSHKKLGRSE